MDYVKCVNTLCGKRDICKRYSVPNYNDNVIYRFFIECRSPTYTYFIGLEEEDDESLSD
jgi:hypothetical protein